MDIMVEIDETEDEKMVAGQRSPKTGPRCRNRDQPWRHGHATSFIT